MCQSWVHISGTYIGTYKNVTFPLPRCSYVSKLLVDSGVEAKCVEATDDRKKVMEEEPKVAADELTCDTPAASLETTGKHIDPLRLRYTLFISG